MFRSRLSSRLLACLAVALVLGSAGMLYALGIHHPQKAAKQQVEELEQQWRAATLGGDVASIDRLLSDDYVGISWNGQVSTKPMQLDRLRTRAFTVSRLELQDSKVKVVGNVAIVTSLALLEGTSEGTEIKGTFRYTRVYQKLASGVWKITNFEATRVPDGAERPRHTHAPTD